jgi:hypothetical protein
MADGILLFVSSNRDECIVCVVTAALVTVAGQSFAKRLLAPRVKLEGPGVLRALVMQRNPSCHLEKGPR